MANKKTGLGRGLDSLFQNTSQMDNEHNKVSLNSNKRSLDVSYETFKTDDFNKIYDIKIENIIPNKEQPRKKFDEEKIIELADSIREHGIIQPLVIKKIDGDKFDCKEEYEIIAGERRYRASKYLGLETLPCIIKELSEKENMLLAIIENMQRENLNPIEEAEGLNKMIESYNMTQGKVAKSIGKSRVYVTNALRLLKLPVEIRNMIFENKISNGHGRALINIENFNTQMEIAEKICNEKLSVRETEKLVYIIKNNGNNDSKNKDKTDNKDKSAKVITCENKLKDKFKTKVNIKKKGKKGKIEIEFNSEEEFERLLELL